MLKNSIYKERKCSMSKHKEDESKYLPYHKSDFKEFWFNSFSQMFEKLDIIRPLTEAEKENYEGEYSEECYLIKGSDGVEQEVYDTEILKSDEFDRDEWECIIINVFERMAGDKDMMQDFIEFCKFEKFIKRWY